MGNVAAAVALPALFAWWLRSQVPVDDLAPGEGPKIEMAIRAFAAAWVIFLVALNVTLALFLWLKSSDL